MIVYISVDIPNLGTAHAYTEGLGSKLGMLVSLPDLHAHTEGLGMRIVYISLIPRPSVWYTHTEGLGMRLCRYICVCVRLVITSKLEFQALQLR